MLVAGGEKSSGVLASAELYDPATNIWSPAGNLKTGRQSHTATLLPSGKVLVVGGAGSRDLDTDFLASAELYDPATNTWSPADDLMTARHSHTATLLPSGQVLVVGGFGSGAFFKDFLASAELYDPATHSWSPAGDLMTARGGHTATLLLPSGKVLVANQPLSPLQRRAV